MRTLRTLLTINILHEIAEIFCPAEDIGAVHRLAQHIRSAARRARDTTKQLCVRIFPVRK